MTQSQIRSFNELQINSNKGSSFKLEHGSDRKKSKSQSSFYSVLGLANQDKSLESNSREDSQETKKFDDLINLLDGKLKKAGQRKNLTKKEFGKKPFDVKCLKKDSYAAGCLRPEQKINIIK